MRAAANIARYTEEDPCAGLPDPELMPTELPDLDLTTTGTWTLRRPNAGARVRSSGSCADPAHFNSEGAQVTTQQSCRVYGNSHGFIGSMLGTRHGASCAVIADDGSGMQRDYWYTVARSAGALEALPSVGQRAAERAVNRLAPRRIPTGRVPVLFAPEVATGLIGHLLGALSGGAQYRKASFLLDALGQAGGRQPPDLARGTAPARRAGQRRIRRRRRGHSCDKPFVAAGIVENYMLSSYSGRKLGMPTTGNAGGVFNLTVRGESRPFAELLTTMNRGLLVTELMGQGVNGVTGDYSRGASGFWVENGEIAYPVHEVTIAGNLKDMYRNLVCVGDDLDTRGNIRAPSGGVMTVMTLLRSFVFLNCGQGVAMERAGDRFAERARRSETQRAPEERTPQPA